MLRQLASLLAITCVAVASIASRADEPPGGNLLANPGFEQIVTQEDIELPVEWLVSKYASDIEVVLDNTDAHGGENSLKIFAKAARPRLGAAVYQAKIPVAAGRKYQLTAWVKSEELRRLQQPGSATVQMNCMNAENQRVALFVASARAPEEWTEVTCIGIVPDSAVTVTITCVWGDGCSDGTMWFDDLIFEEVAE